MRTRRPVWRRHLPFLLGLALCWAVQAVVLGQNKYEVLAHVLQPYGTLFYSKSPSKAWRADLQMQAGAPPASIFMRGPLRLSLQIPDHLRIETIGPGDHVIFCRQGQRVWVYPRDFADRLLAVAGPPGPPTHLPDFRLPLQDNQIVLLPALFQITAFTPIRDAENEGAWNLELHPATELLQASRQAPWQIQTVVRQRDYQVRQLAVRAGDRSAKFQVLQMRFESTLPPETWVPTPAEAATVREIPPGLYGPILNRLTNLPLE
jgi:outer membrane lipoprotein-sorting protein